MQTRKATRQARSKLTTSMADLGSVVRLNPNNFNTFKFSLVLDETLKLIETPVANPIVYYLSSSLLPDAFEVFHYNLVSVEVGNNVLTNVMINPLHPTSFSSANLPKKTLGGKSAFSLKFGTQIFELPFDLFDLCRIIKSAVGSDSEVVYSEVNAQNIVLRTNVLLSGSNLFRECEQEEASSSFIHSEKTLRNIPTEIFFVANRNIEFELLPTFEKSKNESISFDISTSWEIVSDRSPLDYGFCLGSLDYTASLPHTSDSYLGRYFKLLSDIVVDNIMKFEILSNLMLPSIVNTELKSLSVSFDSSNYLFSWIDSDFGSDIRSHSDYKTKQVYKGFGGWQFLSRINSGVSLPCEL